MMDRKPVQNM